MSASPSSSLDAGHTRAGFLSRLPILDGFRGRVRGQVLLLLCAMYFITYIDRVNIATTAPFIQRDLGLDNTELGLVFSAFAIPYAFFQIFGGYIGDRWGPKRVLAVVGLIWGISTIATGFATGLVSLFIARLLLGFGEGAAFPTATHAMAKWIPAEGRARAQGYVHAASRIANALTPAFVAVLITLYDWRLSFWVCGAISLVWTIYWLAKYHNSPSSHPKMTQQELSELSSDQLSEHRVPVPWGPLLKRILPVTFIDFCYGWSLWVFLSWIPSFFADRFGMNLKHFAFFTTIVLIAGVVGDAVGGILSDALVHRTSQPTARRVNLIVGLLGAFVFVIPVLLLSNVWLVAISLALSFFFLELTNSVLWTIPMDVDPQHAGLGGGIMNTGFGVAGIVSPLLFGLMLDLYGSWALPFAVSAVLLFVGAAVSLFINPRPLAQTSVPGTRAQ